MSTEDEILAAVLATNRELGEVKGELGEEKAYGKTLFGRLYGPNGDGGDIPYLMARAHTHIKGWRMAAIISPIVAAVVGVLVTAAVIAG